MNWALISLIGLVGVIALSNWKKINVGVVGIAFAFIIGTLGGLKLRDIYSAFNTQIFLRIFGMQCLIVIARQNGTLTIIANGIMSLCKGKLVRILPIFLWVAIGVANWFNLGVNSIMQPMIAALAFEMGFKNPMTLMFICLAVSCGWGYSQYSLMGNDMIGHAATYGIEFTAWNMGMVQLICGTIFFFINYFYFGWHKKDVDMAEREKVSFDKNNILTLCGFAAFIIGNLVFKIDMMITPIVVAVILMTLGVADPNKCIKSIPYSTLMMLGGMSVYVGIIRNLGGVDLLAGWITAIATEHTVAAIMILIAGFMSVFASANSVVIPTLVAIVPAITAALPGVSGETLLYTIGIASNSTAISPMSTVGGNMMGYASACYGFTPEEERKVFNSFLIEAVLILVIDFTLALIGVFNLRVF